MTSYANREPVDAVALTRAAAIDDRVASMLAFAPDGKTWASAWGSGARVYEGDQLLREQAAPNMQNNAARAIDFSRDGATLWLGTTGLEVATGARNPRPTMPDLAAWAAAASYPAPPTLSIAAARTSADGALVVVIATGWTYNSRREGKQPPATGDVDWLIALDGTSHQPTAVLWHGRGEPRTIAISDQYVAAGSGGSLRVFARDDLTKAIDLGPAARGATGLAWSPDGALLAAATGGERKIAVWRTGQWDAPAAIWEAGGGYHSAVAFHPTRPVLVVGNHDGHLRLYGVGTTALSSPPLVLDHDLVAQPNSIAFSPDGKSVLVATSPMQYQTQPGQIVRFDVALSP